MSDMKKVVICASNTFYHEAEQWKKVLENNGHDVIKKVEKLNPNSEYQTVYADHYKRITESDMLFILNLEKNGIKDYVGPSVFAEIAFAIGLNISFGKEIKIYVLNPLPKNLSYSSELTLWKKLGWIKLWDR